VLSFEKSLLGHFGAKVSWVKSPGRHMFSSMSGTDTLFGWLGSMGCVLGHGYERICERKKFLTEKTFQKKVSQVSHSLQLMPLTCKNSRENVGHFCTVKCPIHVFAGQQFAKVSQAKSVSSRQQVARERVE